MSQETEFWLALAGIIVPSVVVVVFAVLNYFNGKRWANDSAQRDDAIGKRIDRVEERVERRVAEAGERFEGRLSGLQRDLQTVITFAAYAAGLRQGTGQSQTGTAESEQEGESDADQPH